MYGYSTSMMLINPFIYSSAPPVSTEFKITVDTTKAGSASDTFVLPLQVGTTSMTVYWGDGNSDLITSYNQAELSHTYASSGTYQISCDGSFAGVRFTGGGDKLKLSSIDNWGTNQWKALSYAFFGCTNVVGTYTDSPDTSLATGTAIFMFRNCTNFNSPLTMDTSGITAMPNMFEGCTNFNSDVTFSDTSSVTNMSLIFNGCTNFDKAINFNTAALTTMSAMFKNCSSFNQTINFVSPLLTTVSDAFHSCSSLNSTIDIDVSSCASFIRVFYNCTVFDQDLSGWNISTLTAANNMLFGTSFSTTNYDLLLVAWQGQTHNSSVNFHAGTAQYSSGAPSNSRALLISDSWTITDGGAV